MNARSQHDQQEPEKLPDIMRLARSGDWTDMATHRMSILLRTAREVEGEIVNLLRDCGEISTENATQQAALREMALVFTDFGNRLGPILQTKVDQLQTGLTKHTAKVIEDIHKAHSADLSELEKARKALEAMRIDVLDARKGLELAQGELMMDQMKVAADRAEVESDRKVFARRKSEFERRVEAFAKKPLWQRIFPPKAAERRARDEG